MSQKLIFRATVIRILTQCKDHWMSGALVSTFTNCSARKQWAQAHANVKIAKWVGKCLRMNVLLKVNYSHSSIMAVVGCFLTPHSKYFTFKHWPPKLYPFYQCLFNLLESDKSISVTRGRKQNGIFEKTGFQEYGLELIYLMGKRIY